ncbi:Dyp-type peroxidase [Corynebacterium aquatimens]|uniref:Iron-dependent peroxidase n=1 Tax=Corynebacterium aquatimens TaxID=1190508 RepID=A0A931DW96_9CORY|nr:Dyp-type peroxidase [Corynebacterium aquatimens]MBG6121265.1 putative iron-dependent peroxidase [Corynebacterium aquatimens]
MSNFLSADVSQTVVQPQSKSAIFLTVTIRTGAEAATLEILEELGGLVHAVGFRDPTAHLNCVVGIGSLFWDRVFDPAKKVKPEQLHEFVELTGGKHHAPSTPGDLFFHIRADEFDRAFDLARRITKELGDAISGSDEVHAFRYLDFRDPLGFVDGTESPSGQEAVEVGLIQDGPWAGGSYIVEQKYIHDLRSWDALSTRDQELVVGRTKAEDIELDDDEKPLNSHVALNTIEDEEGNELKIVRNNLAFGTASGDQGTFFISYANDVRITELMLRRMFIGEPPGNHDRILDFSTALTGCLFFAPPAEFLDNILDFARDEFIAEIDAEDDQDNPIQPAITLSQATGLWEEADAGTASVGSAQPAAAPASQPAAAPTEPSRGDGSLGIGSLKGMYGSDTTTTDNA